MMTPYGSYCFFPLTKTNTLLITIRFAPIIRKGLCFTSNDTLLTGSHKEKCSMPVIDSKKAKEFVDMKASSIHGMLAECSVYHTVSWIHDGDRRLRHTPMMKLISTLADANCAGGAYSEMRINGESEDWIYFSNRNSDVSNVHVEQSLLQSSKWSLLSWRKRILNFRSPKKAKGEPLLKKAYGEKGGDDVDFDRGQRNSSNESLLLGWA